MDLFKDIKRKSHWNKQGINFCFPTMGVGPKADIFIHLL